ncbi:MAG: hypothetical protein C4545_06275 [Anaerolineaceae bacterium]|nr:MAG: hypothetical protein C4545_06275 [Anaerolineaceae bacterium]
MITGVGSILISAAGGIFLDVVRSIAVAYCWKRGWVIQKYECFRRHPATRCTCMRKFLRILA